MASSFPSSDVAASTDQKTMRGWTHTSTGSPEKVLGISSDLPIPSLPTGDEIMVKISHAALNPGGSIIMQLCPFIFRTTPVIPEMDFSGSIVQVGQNIPEFRNLNPGSEVFGSISVGSHVRAGKGALAEYVKVQAEDVFLKPDAMSREEAAGLSITGCTAFALLDAVKLEKGMLVLVNGASGGIGSLALQMVKKAVGESGKVVAICSKGNFGMVKSLGADEVVDYHDYAPVHKFLTNEFRIAPFDVIIDAFGVQDLFLNCAGYLKPGKPYVTVGVAMSTYSMGSIFSSVGQMMSNILWPKIFGGTDRPYVQVTGRSNLKDMERLASMAQDGDLKVPIDSCWDFEDVLEAYKRMLSRHAKGKIIVKI